MGFWLFMLIMNLLIPLIGSVVPTEKALERTFDKNGKRHAMTKGLNTEGTASPHDQK